MIAPVVGPSRFSTFACSGGCRYTLAELVACGTLTEAMATQLRAAVHERKNILISGATSSGKTTLLNALPNEIPDDERIFLIEDTAEIRLNKPHVVSSESQSSTHKQEISFDTLLKAALRHRSDPIILGEVRGAEARTLLDAMNTGHDGALTTIHASSPGGALRRLAALAIRASGQMTVRDAEEEVRISIGVVLQIARLGGQRRVIAAQTLTA